MHIMTRPTARARHRRSVQLIDLAPPAADLRADALAGLSAPQKYLPCKYLYDDLGSWLFEQICELPEYYPTRTELAITRAHAAELAAVCGPGCALLEFGSGSSVKTRILLEHLSHPAAYVPIDISRVHLLTAAEALAFDYPRVPILPVCGDFTREIPPLDLGERRTVVYFPGSTIGNFVEDEAVALLRGIAARVGPGGGLLIGVDLQKDAKLLHAAYNDARGVTAAFNLNLLSRLNRELGADFDLDAFAHLAVYDPAAARIEMRLVSRYDQVVRIDGRPLVFAAGEHILSEYAHKYTREGFAALAARAGLQVRQVWTDPAELFSVQYLTPATPS